MSENGRRDQPSSQSNREIGNYTETSSGGACASPENVFSHSLLNRPRRNRRVPSNISPEPVDRRRKMKTVDTENVLHRMRKAHHSYDFVGMPSLEPMIDVHEYPSLSIYQDDGMGIVEESVVEVHTSSYSTERRSRLTYATPVWRWNRTPDGGPARGSWVTPTATVDSTPHIRVVTDRQYMNPAEKWADIAQQRRTMLKKKRLMSANVTCAKEEAKYADDVPQSLLMSPSPRPCMQPTNAIVMTNVEDEVEVDVEAEDTEKTIPLRKEEKEGIIYEEEACTSRGASIEYSHDELPWKGQEVEISSYSPIHSPSMDMNDQLTISAIKRRTSAVNSEQRKREREERQRKREEYERILQKKNEDLSALKREEHAEGVNPKLEARRKARREYMRQRRERMRAELSYDDYQEELAREREKRRVREDKKRADPSYREHIRLVKTLQTRALRGAMTEEERMHNNLIAYDRRKIRTREKREQVLSGERFTQAHFEEDELTMIEEGGKDDSVTGIMVSEEQVVKME